MAGQPELDVALEHLHRAEIRVLEQGRSACESISDQVKKLTSNIMVAGEELVRKVANWEDENLAKLRQRRTDLVRALVSSDDVEAKALCATRITTEDILVNFLPSPHVGVDRVGLLDMKQVEVGGSETVVDHLKVQMEKEMNCKENENRKKAAIQVVGSKGKQSNQVANKSVVATGKPIPKQDKRCAADSPKPSRKADQGAKEMRTGDSKAAATNTTTTSKTAVGSPNRPSWATEGSSCLVRSKKLDWWCEAQILKHQPPNLYMVLFVRTGEHVVVGPEQIVKEEKDLPAGQITEAAALRSAKEELKSQLMQSNGKVETKEHSQPEVGLKGADLKKTWNLGSVCVARWVEDGVWYRANVLEALEGNSYTVRFVDYGNTANVNAADMVRSRKEVPEGGSIDECVIGAVGSSCLALYKEEMIWCRAKIVSEAPSGWEVEFVDYNGERASLEDQDLINGVEEVPEGHDIDPIILNDCAEAPQKEEVLEEVVVERTDEEAKVNQEDDEECSKEPSSEGSCFNREGAGDVDLQEPSMEMEKEDPGSQPVVPVPATPEQTSASGDPAPPPPAPVLSTPDNAVLQLAPKDLCLAVWAEDGVLYNAEFLSWQDDKREADVLFVDYENVERVAVKDMYVKFSDVPAFMAEQELVDINVDQGGIVALPPPSIESTSPVLRLSLSWSVEISWAPQPSSRLAILPNGKVVAALPHEKKVLLYNKEGKFKGTLGTFENPNGVTALPGGKMAVLDGKRIVVFSKSGEKQELAPQGFNTTSDLCADHEGALVTINRCDHEERNGTVTKPGQTDLFYVQEKSGKIEKRMEMEDIIEEESKCTLISSSAGRLHVGDQGLNQVYILYMEDGDLQAAVCGSPEQWGEVSSIAGMGDGGVFVLDAVTQRILRISPTGELMGHAEVDGGLFDAVAIASLNQSLVVASNGLLTLYKVEEME